MEPASGIKDAFSGLPAAHNSIQCLLGYGTPSSHGMPISPPQTRSQCLTAAGAATTKPPGGDEPK
eukprot:537769-Pelagomonas_calceolata.AAC.2